MLFARISPIHRVDRITAPVLIAHGTRDPRVPIGESEQYVTALQERQKQVTYLTFDYAGHGFVRPGRQAPGLSRHCRVLHDPPALNWK